MAFEYTMVGTTRALWRMDSMSSTRVGDATSNNYDLYTDNSFSNPSDFGVDGLFKYQVPLKSPYNSVSNLYLYSGGAAYPMEMVGATTVSIWIQYFNPDPFPPSGSNPIYILRAQEGIRLGATDYILGSSYIDLNLSTASSRYISARICVFNEAKTEAYGATMGLNPLTGFEPEIYNNITLVHNGASNGATVKMFINGELRDTASASIVSHTTSGNENGFWNMPSSLSADNNHLNFSECIVDGAAWSDAFCASYGSQRSNKYNFTISPGT